MKYTPPSIEKFRDIKNYHIAQSYYETLYMVRVYKSDDNEDNEDKLKLIYQEALDNFDKLELQYFKQFKSVRIENLRETFDYYSLDTETINHEGLIKLFRDLNIPSSMVGEDDTLNYDDFVDFMNNRSFVRKTL